MGAAIIQVSNLSKTYRAFDIDRKDSGIGLWVKNIFRLTANRASTVQALQNISFHIEAGEVFGIFGANGAGKTTLIKILSGLLLPEAGRVRVNGDSRPNRIKDMISYVSTNGWMGLEWQLTTYENLLLYGQLFGLNGATLHARCDTALNQFDLAMERDKHISALSAGMRQKVTLARGLLLDRPVLYLDEPTVSLDVPAAARVREIATTYAAAPGKTVIITSHNPVDLSICNRILFLHQGRLVALGTLAEMMQPLQGIQALHLTCAGDHGNDEIMAGLTGAMLSLPGVKNVSLERAQGRQNNWQLRVVISQTPNPTGSIVDWFIGQGIQILELRMKPITLQEIYEHYVKAAAHDQT